MTSTRPSLSAASRTEVGKAAAHVRAAGRVPAVVYGHGDSVSVSIDAHDLDLLRRHVGANSLIDLEIDGKRPTPVLVHGIQFHKIQRRPIHVDFFRVKMTEEMTVDVAVHGTGSSEAVERHGGTLLHSIDHIKVRARPDHLPSAIEIDITVLATFDDVIRARDLVLPTGVTLVTDPDEIVLRVSAPRVVEEPVVAEAAAVEAPTEAAAEGDAS